jgi:thiamine biosynthesis lipoprotein
VTSGIYERYFEQAGKRYHHILSSNTGYPVDNELASVTVITESSIDADALSTVLFASGIEDGIAFLKKYNPEIGAAFVTKDNKIYGYNLEQFDVEWTDSEFEIVQ